MGVVCIYSAPDHFNALSAREILEANDIITLFPTEYSSMTGSTSFIMGKYRLQVNEIDAEKAIDILKANGFIEAENVFIDPNETKEPYCDRCPLCKSQNIESVEKDRYILNYFVSLFSGNEKRFYYLKYTCNQCNFNWKRPQISNNT
ncbi:MAG: hypothetical protein PQJ59_15815 [Spirochaetales bacterium]|nr:hypothetical protein [Spirochaetales bacterium]